MSGIRTLADLRDRCRVDDITGCWCWSGAMANTTPCFRLPALRKVVGAGAGVCFLLTGELPAPGVVWHRTCETGRCVRPEHRQAGTRTTQMARLVGTHRPALVKARIARSCRARSKVTAEIVDDCRNSKQPGIELAAKHDISSTTVGRIRRLEVHAPLGLSAFSRWAA